MTGGGGGYLRDFEFNVQDSEMCTVSLSSGCCSFYKTIEMRAL